MDKREALLADDPISVELYECKHEWSLLELPFQSTDYENGVSTVSTKPAKVFCKFCLEVRDVNQ